MASLKKMSKAKRGNRDGKLQKRRRAKDRRRERRLEREGFLKF